MTADAVDEIVRFWFEELSPKSWFRSDPAIDAEIASRFGGIYDGLKEGVPADWLSTPKGLVAAILVLDQFPRNMFVTMRAPSPPTPQPWRWPSAP